MIFQYKHGCISLEAFASSLLLESWFTWFVWQIWQICLKCQIQGVCNKNWHKVQNRQILWWHGTMLEQKSKNSKIFNISHYLQWVCLIFVSLQCLTSRKPEKVYMNVWSVKLPCWQKLINNASHVILFCFYDNIWTSKLFCIFIYNLFT